MPGQKSARRAIQIVLIGGGVILLILPLTTAAAVILPITVGLQIDAKGFVVLLGMAVSGTALVTSGLWMAGTSKRS